MITLRVLHPSSPSFSFYSFYSLVLFSSLLLLPFPLPFLLERREKGKRGGRSGNGRRRRTEGMEGEGTLSPSSSLSPSSLFLSLFLDLETHCTLTTVIHFLHSLSDRTSEDLSLIFNEIQPLTAFAHLQQSVREVFLIQQLLFSNLFPV